MNFVKVLCALIVLVVAMIGAHEQNIIPKSKHAALKLAKFQLPSDLQTDSLEEESPAQIQENALIYMNIAYGSPDGRVLLGSP